MIMRMIMYMYVYIYNYNTYHVYLFYSCLVGEKESQSDACLNDVIHFWSQFFHWSKALIQLDPAESHWAVVKPWRGTVLPM